MTRNIIVAGSGGQGVIALGKLIAHSAALDGKEICCWPHYGAEMRGGTARCSVIVSTQIIESPISTYFDIAVTMNYPSLVSFENKVMKGGQLLWNSSLISKGPVRDDIETYPVEATAIAAELGNIKVANIVFLGCIAVKTGIFSVETCSLALDKFFVSTSLQLREINKLAIQRGAQISAL